ncbi:hypothetical protein SISNIDRAFT_458934, partial [Sistotremastrum niveocremeum HHB9708]
LKQMERKDPDFDRELIPAVEYCLREVSWTKIQKVSAIQATALLGFSYMQKIQRTGQGPNEAYLSLLLEAYLALRNMCNFAFKGCYPKEAKYWTTREREREMGTQLTFEVSFLMKTFNLLKKEPLILYFVPLDESDDTLLFSAMVEMARAKNRAVGHCYSGQVYGLIISASCTQLAFEPKDLLLLRTERLSKFIAKAESIIARFAPAGIHFPILLHLLGLLKDDIAANRVPCEMLVLHVFRCDDFPVMDRI